MIIIEIDRETGIKNWESLSVKDTFRHKGRYYIVSEYEDTDETDIKVAVNLQSGDMLTGVSFRGEDELIYPVNLVMREVPAK